jgi:hypothetical protein
VGDRLRPLPRRTAVQPARHPRRGNNGHAGAKYAVCLYHWKFFPETAKRLFGLETADDRQLVAAE